MAIEAKAMLLTSLEKELSVSVPAAEMTKVLSAVSNQLSNYEVKEIERANNEADDLLEAYEVAMKVQGRSDKTIARYVYLIRRLMDSINVSTRSVTVYHLRKYLSDEKERGLTDRTLEGMRQVFNTYFNWLYRERLIDVNPVANLGAIKWKKKIKSIYSEVDIERMKYSCKTDRDRAIVCFLLSTGCRISEMTQLNRSDVNLTTLECIVLGKGSKERTVYLDSVAGMMLQTYLDQRKDDYPALFVGRGSERITPNAVRRMLNIIANKSHVDHIHPHKFRRTLATNLIRHGMPIQEVAAILGHEKLDTTMQYVVLDKTDMKNSYRKYV